MLGGARHPATAKSAHLFGHHLCTAAELAELGERHYTIQERVVVTSQLTCAARASTACEQ